MTFLADLQEKKDDDVVPVEEDEDMVFDQTPVQGVNCPHCGVRVTTFIEHESSWVTYSAAIVLLMMLGWAALCVVPIVYPLFKDVVHHCPRCLNVLATRSRVAINGFRSEVMSLRFGSCVIVLARKWVLLLVCLSVLIGGIHTLRNSGAPNVKDADTPTRGEVQPVTWEDYSKDCGFKSYLGNPIHVTTAFKQKYKKKTFRWQGKVHHIEEGFTLLWWSQRGAIFVRMQPPQITAKRDIPDVVLLYEDSDEKISKEVYSMKKGAEFTFEASMVEVGRRGAPHTMMLWELSPATASASGGNGTGQV
mmetsp:Transcript_126519/g.219350  ORF Transcript_126519/g.219350 Transcript_126519/m.219350 type:complete len:305 (+) Transcript_126519:136-1050(+)